MKKIANYLENLSDDFKRMHLIDIVNDYEIVIYDELNLIKEAANAKQIRKNQVAFSMKVLGSVLGSTWFHVALRSSRDGQTAWFLTLFPFFSHTLTVFK